MSKILFITAFTPSNSGAGVSYTHQLLHEMSKEHQLDLVYFGYPGEKEYSSPNANINILYSKRISKYSRFKGIVSLMFLFPLFSSRFSWTIVMKLRKLIKKNTYDVIYFDFSQTFSYSLFLTHPNKVMMAHDVIYQRYKRANSSLSFWVKCSENILIKKAKAVFTFSEKDSAIIKQQYNVESKSTTFFINKDATDAIPSKDTNYFVFFGGWSRYDNYEALEWFLDNVYHLIPLCYTFKIIGGGLSDRICKRISVLDNVEYLGFVDNPYEIIANARAELAPLHFGAGVKVKCIEALACGIPIIGTNVAFEGIGEEYSSYMLLADSPEDYVKAMSECNVTVEDKLKAKDNFLSTYNNKTILQYLRTNNN